MSEKDSTTQTSQTNNSSKITQDIFNQPSKTTTELRTNGKNQGVSTRDWTFGKNDD